MGTRVAGGVRLDSQGGALSSGPCGYCLRSLPTPAALCDSDSCSGGRRVIMNPSRADRHLSYGDWRSRGLDGSAGGERQGQISTCWGLSRLRTWRAVLRSARG